MQQPTRAGLGFRAGVKDYRLTYFMDVIDTDLLAAFRVFPQPIQGIADDTDDTVLGSPLGLTMPLFVTS